MKHKWFVHAAKFLLLAVIASFAIGFIVMMLWNALIPDLFKGPVVSYWQSIGLLLLSHILLRGWGKWRYTNGWRSDHWRNRFEEKLATMTPDEREKFREEWKHRCGSFGPTDNPDNKTI